MHHHGFLRDESHSQDRYVCECEYWTEPTQEPVGYISTVPVVTPQAIRADRNDVFNIPVYTHPVPPCQECANLKHDLEGYMEANKALINREWQTLSDDEVDAIASREGVSLFRIQDIFNAFEQELKTKNGFSELKEKNTCLS